MAARHLPAQAVFAVGFALAIMIAPVIAPSAKTQADTPYNNCMTQQTQGSYALECSPLNVMPPYANLWNPQMSEQALTLQNQHRR
jgi:hypothetical protein